MIDVPRCFERNCVHFLGAIQPDGTELTEIPYCLAYPEGIPVDICYGEDLHSEIRKDQSNAIVYQKGE